MFNEGYATSSGEVLTRTDLSTEAIRLGRLVLELLPSAEGIGLLALMLLQESRRTARTSSTGDLILLEDQDRSRWNQSWYRVIYRATIERTQHGLTCAADWEEQWMLEPPISGHWRS